MMRTSIWFQRWVYVATVLCVSLSAVQAKTIYVNGNGAADYKTIKAAVKAAKSGDTIVVEPGTYRGEESRNILLSGKTLTICSTDPDDPNVVAETIVDCYVDEAQKERDMVDGVEISGYRFIEMVPDTGAALTLKGLTVINTSDAFSGGVVECEAAELTAVNCTFADNSVEQWGGVVCCQDAEATFEGCSFVSNVSTKRRGGAVYAYDSAVSFTRCDFSANSGNAVWANDSSITLIQCAFESNVGEFGGAVYYSAASNVANNVVLVVDRCTFTGNSTQNTGGAIHVEGSAGTIAGCTFTENYAKVRGGAVCNRQASPTLSSCIFMGNTCTGAGGAVANYIRSAPIILNCTFVNNQATNGGAVTSVRDTHPTISHCILWNNTATNGADLYLAQDTYSHEPSRMTVEYSDLRQEAATVYTPSGTSLIWGRGNISSDPLFTQPAFDVYRLSADSPCIDAGDPEYSVDEDAVDLDGYRRLFGQTVDMGAFEYQGLSAVYRFWSAPLGRHFYTILGAERDKLIKNYPSVWQYENVAYWAFYGPTEPGLAPVYRFWSPVLESHIWTTNEDEKNKILKEYPDVYDYEGIVFYAYNPGQQPLSTVPVYRFWSDRLGHHFYTMNETERDKLINDYPETWTYEGIVWYVHPRAYQLQESDYVLQGGTDAVSYTMVLSAYVDGKEVSIDEPYVSLIPDKSQMEMSVGFSELTATINGMEVQTSGTDHVATIDPKGAAIPFTLSLQATFECTTLQGIFEVDSTTGIFADFSDAGQALTTEGCVYSYNGQVAFNNGTVGIDATAEALELNLESYGLFNGLDSLPDDIYVLMPSTFEWTRAGMKDLLVATEVDGRSVQLYVTSMSVATDGQWAGQIQE